MKPIIGIIPAIDEMKGQYFISEDHIQSITFAGGLPLMLPYVSHDMDVNDIINKLDGLYLTGGNDIDPSFFNEEPHQNLGEVNRIRDIFEIMCTKRAIMVKRPVFAVCRGAQILNIALGGDMYQDIYAQHKGELLQHQQQAIKSHPSHDVHLTTNSLLYELIGKKRIKVNSRHHQANRRLGQSLAVAATASDGVIEAVEQLGNAFVLGVQWHPENMAVTNDEPSLALYDGFIRACKK